MLVIFYLLLSLVSAIPVPSPGFSLKKMFSGCFGGSCKPKNPPIRSGRRADLNHPPPSANQLAEAQIKASQREIQRLENEMIRINAMTRKDLKNVYAKLTPDHKFDEKALERELEELQRQMKLAGEIA